MPFCQNQPCYCVLCSPRCPNLGTYLIMFPALALTLHDILSCYNAPSIGLVSSPQTALSAPTPLPSPQTQASRHCWRTRAHQALTGDAGWETASSSCILPKQQPVRKCSDDSISGSLSFCPEYPGGAKSKSIFVLLSGLPGWYCQLIIKLWT